MTIEYIVARMKVENENLTTLLTFRVTDDEATRLAALAKKQERNVAGMLRKIFRRGLKTEERMK